MRPIILLPLLCAVVGCASAGWRDRYVDERGRLPAVHPGLQSLAERSLVQGLRNAQAESGFVVLAGVETGQILALAAGRREKEGSFGAEESVRILWEPLQPWSLIKPFVTAVALENGKLRDDETLDCGDGEYVVDGDRYRDPQPFSQLTPAGMILHSSTICAIKVAEKLSADELIQGLKRFGFSNPADLASYPGARSGKLPELGAQSSTLTRREIARLATGYQDLEVTPLELVQAYAALARGGKQYEPKEYTTTASPPVFLHQVVSAKTAALVTQYLSQVVTQGTGKAAAVSGYTAAGKTGTGGEPGRRTTSFAGFAPAEHPRLVALVIIENPHDGSPQGGVQAAPVFGALMKEALPLLREASSH